QQGAVQLLVDGEEFFPRLRQAVAEATNYIHMDVYIFDRDDVGVQMADDLRLRSAQVNVRVIMDQMGSLAGGNVLPATPLPNNFVQPPSIVSYLRAGS